MIRRALSAFKRQPPRRMNSASYQSALIAHPQTTQKHTLQSAFGFSAIGDIWMTTFWWAWGALSKVRGLVDESNNWPEMTSGDDRKRERALRLHDARRYTSERTGGMKGTYTASIELENTVFGISALNFVVCGEAYALAG
jgi:hypothetical protein